MGGAVVTSGILALHASMSIMCTAHSGTRIMTNIIPIATTVKISHSHQYYGNPTMDVDPVLSELIMVCLSPTSSHV